MSPIAIRLKRDLRRLVLALTTALLLPAGALAQNGAAPTGGQVFMGAHCNICHGQMGSGGAGPALRNNRMLRVTDYVIAQILLGRGIMPSFADKLSDQEIAAVASYIRSNWGNSDGPVSARSVQGEMATAAAGSGRPSSRSR